MRKYAFMKIGICIPPHFFSFLSPQKVKLKFSLLQLKTTTVQPDNKEIKQQTKTRRSYFLTSSQDPIFPSQGCLDRLAYLHHMVIVKGNTSKSGHWAVRNESFSPCALLCHTRDAYPAYKITFKVILGQQDSSNVKDYFFIAQQLSWEEDHIII